MNHEIEGLQIWSFYGRGLPPPALSGGSPARPPPVVWRAAVFGVYE